MKYVLDSSVALKWVVPEADSLKAIRLRDEYKSGLHELLAPDIFIYSIIRESGDIRVQRRKAMNTVKARFDGRVFVPEGPVNLPVGCVVEVPLAAATPTQMAKPPLVELLETLDKLPDDPDWPADGAAQHDHYLYGTPKKS